MNVIFMNENLIQTTKLDNSDHQNPVDENNIEIKYPTKRQLQIVNLIGKGLSNRDISIVLSISEHTVKVHIWRIFKKYKIESRTQALLLFIKLGYVSINSLLAE